RARGRAAGGGGDGERERVHDAGDREAAVEGRLVGALDADLVADDEAVGGGGADRDRAGAAAEAGDQRGDDVAGHEAVRVDEVAVEGVLGGPVDVDQVAGGQAVGRGRRDRGGRARQGDGADGQDRVGRIGGRRHRVRAGDDQRQRVLVVVGQLERPAGDGRRH